jgi:hypothetical protein
LGIYSLNSRHNWGFEVWFGVELETKRSSVYLRVFPVEIPSGNSLYFHLQLTTTE